MSTEEYICINCFLASYQHYWLYPHTLYSISTLGLSFKPQPTGSV